MQRHINFYLKSFVALIIAALHIGYSIFTSNFAELHLKFSFLNFPVFIGEFVLLGSALLLAFAFWDKRYLSNKWFWIYFIYGIWIILKALRGYHTYGPLAFRHAAMFYYAIFAVFAFLVWSTFKKTSWLPESIFITSLILLFKFPHTIHYFLFVHFVICCICLLYFRNHAWRAAGCLLMLVMIPFKKFFQGGSAFILGNLFGMLVLLGGCFWAYKALRTSRKILFTGAVFIVLSAIVFVYAPREEVNTFLNLDFILKNFSERDATIQKGRANYECKNIDPQIYHDNRKELKNQTPARLTGTIPVAGTRGTPMVAEAQGQRPVETQGQRPAEAQGQRHVEVQGQRPVEAQGQRTSETQGQRPAEAQGQRPVEVQGQRPVEAQGQRTSETQGQRPAEVQGQRPSKSEKFETTQGTAFNNVFFRLFIWRDMIEELIETGNLLTGMPFGKPLRSYSIEIINQADAEWKRDGWIEPHNSFLNMIYRGGVIGILIVGAIIFYFFWLLIFFVSKNSYHGLLLLAVILYWMVMAFFSVIYELPYFAIPIWIWWGITYEYYKTLKRCRGKR